MAFSRKSLVTFFFFNIAIVVSFYSGYYLSKKPCGVFYFAPQPAPATAHPPTPKTIVLWTKWFSDDSWQEMFQLNNGSPEWTFDGFWDPGRINTDKKLKCVLSANKSLVDKAAAVVFHSKDLYSMESTPTIRHSWQRWVFFTLESPQHNGISDDSYPRYNDMRFNWTMTYRPNADVWFPYGTIEKRQAALTSKENAETQQRIASFAVDFPKREFDALWIVGNCNGKSNREKLYEFLVNESVKIDRYGICTNRFPEYDWARMGVAKFSTRYRFYFAFENSFCDDYMTEKVFAGYYHNINHGLIPVVFGAGNYSKYLPKGSYINALDMHPIVLARKLKDLSMSPPETISQYSQWQLTHEMKYQVTPGSNYFMRNYALKHGWSSLCQRLWTAPSSERKVITDLKEELGECHQPPV